MEDIIRERFSRGILDHALDAFGISFDQIRELDGFESYIYEFTRGVERGILRITHTIRRAPGQIQGELDWINFLEKGGAGVAQSLPGINGDLLVEIDDGAGGFFLANTFERAGGEIYHGKWSDEFLFEYGRQIALMHKLTTSYSPSDPAWKRPEWDDPIHLDVIDFLPPEDSKIKQIYLDLVEETRLLPKDQMSYGLIHQDAHRGNFFIDEKGKITFFDFDDSSYSWFIEDIALVLFYAVMGQDKPAEFTIKFLEGFLPGYYSEYDLESSWIPKIPLFLKRRELDLYAVIHRSFDIENLDDPWCIGYLNGRNERIEQGVPYLDFDFSQLDLSEYR